MRIDVVPALGLLAALAPSAWARGDEVDALMRREMASRHVMGAVLAVVKDGKVVKRGCYGHANVELGVKVRFDSVFEIGSVSKQFTATLLMMLVEEGKLRLDQPIDELLPGAPPSWHAIQLRHLLGHTSGLKNINDLPNYELHRGLTYEQYLAGLKDEPLEFAPGTKYAYRNTGYALAGYIVQHACGKPYWQVLHERVFRPLKMTSTRDRNPREVVRGRCAGYEWADGKLWNRGTNLTDIFAAGAIASNMPDLLKWNAALDAGRLLKPATLEQMWTSGKLDSGKETGYGIGWGVNRYRGVKLISHGGSTAGFSASISKFVDQRVTVIVLTNCETLNNATVLARLVAGRYIEFPEKS